MNTRYKNSVFVNLFSDEKRLRELYSAVSGERLPPDQPITINTLNDVLYMERVNDISFTAGDRIVVLIEHQSSINLNMALRLLFYIARIYEKILNEWGKTEALYAEKLINLPWPIFIVLYNGKKPYPDHVELRLSTAFREAASLPGIKESAIPPLELIVQVYNINEGHNAGILAQSETLHAYSVFVDKARSFEAAGHARKDALNLAIDWCIKHEVLRDYLRVHASEVRNMLFEEWNWDDALAVRWKEGLEEGLERSVKKMQKHGMTPARIAETLELSLDTVQRYLED
jgi:predicted transposase/invertase (TIGR01784 family)